jgi:hypothetical protein
MFKYFEDKIKAGEIFVKCGSSSKYFIIFQDNGYILFRNSNISKMDFFLNSFMKIKSSKDGMEKFGIIDVDFRKF